MLPGDQIVIVQRGEDEEAEEEVRRFACVFTFFDELKEKARAAAKR
jgi:hypothetical protein